MTNENNPTRKAAQGGVTEAGYVFVCSNPACRAVHIRAPRGFCPACVAENGSGWSTTRQRLYRDGPERYSTEEEGEAFMDGWYDGQAALSAQQGQGEVVSPGSQCQYRHKSLPGVDGERTWFPWQQFSPEMEIRHPVTTGGDCPSVAEALRIYNGWMLEDDFDANKVLRKIVAVLQSAVSPAQPASRDRDAYEGAREDLLDWKGRALRAEATLRSLGYQGVDASEPPAQPAERVPEGLLRKALTIAANIRTADWMEAGGTVREQDALADYLAYPAPSPARGDGGAG